MMALQLRCDRCGQVSADFTTVQTNYSLSRNPRRIRICGACTAAAEADEAPRRFRHQMEQVVDLDGAAARAGMPVEERTRLLRSGGLREAFDALIEEVGL